MRKLCPSTINFQVSTTYVLVVFGGATKKLASSTSPFEIDSCVGFDLGTAPDMGLVSNKLLARGALCSTFPMHPPFASFPGGSTQTGNWQRAN